MTTPIPPGSMIRRPLHYIALWQALSFIMMLCALWACEALGLLHEGPTDFGRLAIPTAILVLGGFIAVAHTFLQERMALHGLITICSYCRKVRVDDHAWTRVEQFVTEHSHVDFTHGVCPACFEKLTDDLTREQTKEQRSRQR